MQIDPYAPPHSSVAGTTPADIAAAQRGDLRYSTFWQRVGAALIDFLIISPMVALDYFLGGSSPYYQWYMLVPNQLVGVSLGILMVWKFGGSPGKLLMGLRIAMLDGSRITLKSTLLRYAIYWSLALLAVIAVSMGATTISAEGYAAMSYIQRSLAITQHAPGWYPIVTVLMQLWVLAGLIAILCNPERRALHDFIAGTVVVLK